MLYLQAWKLGEDIGVLQYTMLSSSILILNKILLQEFFFCFVQIPFQMKKKYVIVQFYNLYIDKYNIYNS